MTTAPLTVRLIADANVTPLGRCLENDPTGPPVRVSEAPFGQLWPTLERAGRGESAEPAADAAIVWASPESVSAAFGRRLAGETASDREIAADIDRYADALDALLTGWAQARGASVMVPSFTSAPWQRGLGMLDLRPNMGLRHALLQMNLRLADRLAAGNAFLLDADRWLVAAGPDPCPPQAWFAGKVPFAGAVFREAARDIKAALAGLRGQARKLLVLDLDDTLWGGIVGDVGIEGLRLGGHDAIGEGYAAFQRALLALYHRGIQLAIVSKNEEQTALEAIDRHPEMVLRRQHFAGWRISWGDKAAAILELCAELRLGSEAVVFIDDNPVERARVAETLPEVLVPDWPRDPCRYRSALGTLRCFDQPTVSEEDRTRGQMAATGRARRAEQAAVGSLTDWLSSLDQVVPRGLLTREDLARTAQLVNKTNQMNLTTRRLEAQELLDWLADGTRTLWTFRVTDRFGASGLTGILSTEESGDELRIVDFILSCRVMGRCIEETLLHTAIDHARQRGLTRVVAHYRPTKRNAPCLAFFRGCGFDATPNADETVRFSWGTTVPFPLPAAVRLVDAATAAGGTVDAT